MRRHIKLREMSDIPMETVIEECRMAGLGRNDYKLDELQKAREVHERRNLRFDNQTGITRDDRDGILSQYVSPSDHEPATRELDVFVWQFMPYLNNTCSRVRRGYTP